MQALASLSGGTYGARRNPRELQLSSVLAPLPPFVQLSGFLPKTEHRQLLDWVLAHPDAFGPATITGKGGVTGRIDPIQRVALTAPVPEATKDGLQARLLAALGEIAEAIGYSGPPPTSFELQLAAHGDGAHYRPHLDIPLGQSRAPLGAAPGEDRVLSAVYYFHCEPKGFSGGALRLHRFGADWDRDEAEPSSFVDIDPIDNSLVAFPSWAMHEVRPVHCPSERFEDYRFALNCWFCRPT